MISLGRVACVLTATLLLMWVGASPAWAVLNVVTTTSDLKSLAEAVGGDKVKADCIGSGDQDPHFLQARPSYMLLARNADLWIRIGMELEIGYEGLIIDGSRNPRIREGQPGFLDCSESIIKLDVPTMKVTRDMGDIHPMGNPHYWLDPLNARLMAKAIAERLGQLAPADAEVFRKNYKAFELALDEHMFGKELVQQVGGDRLWAMQLRGKLIKYLDDNKLREKLGGWQGAVLPLRGASIVTYHRSWTYFANRFGLNVAAELEPKPGIPPTPAHLVEVIDAAKRNNVKVILVEVFYSRKAADLVGEKTGAKVIVTANSVGGEAQATDYIALMDMIVGRLAAGTGTGAAGKE